MARLVVELSREAVPCPHRFRLSPAQVVDGDFGDFAGGFGDFDGDFGDVDGSISTHVVRGPGTPARGGSGWGAERRRVG